MQGIEPFLAVNATGVLSVSGDRFGTRSPDIE